MESYVGRKFTRLTVIKESEYIIENNGKRRSAYICSCDCGKEVVVMRHQLQIKNGTKSCGCLRNEAQSKNGLNSRKLSPSLASGKIIFNNSYADGDLSFEYFCEISKKNCHYCNAEPANSHNKYLHKDKWNKVSQYAKNEGLFIYNGLDRVDSSKPHNKDNVVPCCHMCNWGKSNLSLEEFKSHISKIYDHWANKKAQ